MRPHLRSGCAKHLAGPGRLPGSPLSGEPLWMQRQLYRTGWLTGGMTVLVLLSARHGKRVGSQMTRSLRDHVATCDHPACAATRKLFANGANLKLGKGRHCEFAALAAAGPEGLTDAALVEARRRYAEHLGSSLEGRTDGTIANAERAIHARHAADGNLVGMPDAKDPIPLGTARVARLASADGERYDRYFLTW
jgi:hypothetical protein